MSSFYTYFHTRNDTNAVFYVGKGCGKRAYEKRHTLHWKNTVAKHGYQVHIASVWEAESDALDHEKFLIRCFRDLSTGLVNKTDGGEGSSGYRHTQEALDKMSAFFKGKTYAKGHSVSLELRALSSERNKGNTYCVGRVLSDETKAKIRDVQIGRSPDAETRVKIGAASRARKGIFKHSDETKLKMAAIATGRVSSLETRKKMAESAAKRTHSDETRAKMKASWVIRRERDE